MRPPVPAASCVLRSNRFVRCPGALTALGDLLAVDGHVRRRCDADPNFVLLDGEDLDDDRAVDDDLLALFP